ncbi:unnamed protein product, partial [Gulo gulo]
MRTPAHKQLRRPAQRHTATPGGNPRLHEETGGADRWGGRPGPRPRPPGGAGESPRGPAGREEQSGLPGPTDP